MGKEWDDESQIRALRSAIERKAYTLDKPFPHDTEDKKKWQKERLNLIDEFINDLQRAIEYDFGFTSQTAWDIAKYAYGEWHSNFADVPGYAHDICELFEKARKRIGDEVII